MTEQPQTKQLPPLLNTDKEHQMIFNEGIGVIENYGNREWCKILIDAFEMYNSQKLKKNMVSSFLSPKVLGNNIHIQ